MIPGARVCLQRQEVLFLEFFLPSSLPFFLSVSPSEALFVLFSFFLLSRTSFCRLVWWCVNEIHRGEVCFFGILTTLLVYIPHSPTISSNLYHSPSTFLSSASGKPQLLRAALHLLRCRIVLYCVILFDIATTGKFAPYNLITPLRIRAPSE